MRYGYVRGIALSCLLTGAFAAQAAAASRSTDWPEWLGVHREGVWRDEGLLTRFPAGGPKVRWRIPIGPGYTGPSVVDGRVYVMDRQRAKGPDGKPVRATRDGLPGTERVLCLSATDGKLLWRDEYDCPYRIAYSSGPRTTPLVRDGRVYTLGAMGDLRCLDASTGAVRWAKNLAKEYKAEPPFWGWAAHPLLDGDLLYCLVGGEGSAAVAFNKDTGKEVWRALTTEEVCYSPPVIINAGGTRQLIIWHSDSINSLDPATGKVYWSQAYPTSGKPTRPAVNISTVRQMGDLLFVTSAYHGPMMLKLAADRPAATVLWRGKSDRMDKPDGLHGLMATPVLKEGHVYGVGALGELRCQEAATGRKVWETYAPVCGKLTDCGTAFLVPIGDSDRYAIFNDQGDLILAELTPKGYKEIDRAHVLDPVEAARGRIVVWSHPAFAERCVFARNDKEIICLSMAADAS
jgi:outer membrane protein assembly factor BamB